MTGESEWVEHVTAWMERLRADVRSGKRAWNTPSTPRRNAEGYTVRAGSIEELTTATAPIPVIREAAKQLWQAGA